MNASYYIKVLLFSHLVAFTLLMFLPQLRRRAALSGWLSTGATLCSLVSACTLLNGYLDTPSTLPVIHHTPWLSVGGQSIATLGWLIDGTSIVMLVVVNAIALCIQVYAQGFHATDSTSVTHADRCAGYALLLFAMNLDCRASPTSTHHGLAGCGCDQLFYDRGRCRARIEFQSIRYGHTRF